jgi:hypothetical protein
LLQITDNFPGRSYRGGRGCLGGGYLIGGGSYCCCCCCVLAFASAFRYTGVGSFPTWFCLLVLESECGWKKNDHLLRVAGKKTDRIISVSEESGEGST